MLKWCPWLLERTVSLEIDKAYSDLKATLLEKGFKILSEEQPEKILAKQGSLWGMSPLTAKKIVEVDFASEGSGTKVTCSSRMSSDWKNLTLAGCAVAAILVGLCLWMTFDLSAFLATGKASFWSWLVTVNGNVDAQVAQGFVNLTKALAVFLFVIILLEVVIFFYVRNGINKLAEETLNSLSQEKTGQAT